MARTTIKVNTDAPFNDPKVWANLERIAGRICYDANQTSAKIGITYRTLGTGTDKRVLIGPRGKAAIPVEYGTYFMAGKGYVKRALDRARVRGDRGDRW